MTGLISLPSGRRVTVGEYVRSWKVLKRLPLGRDVDGWEWYPMPVREILKRISYGVQDRVNIRGGLVIRSLSESRLYKKIRAYRRKRMPISECRWCGCSLGHYEPEHNRFCDVGCYRCFNNH